MSDSHAFPPTSSFIEYERGGLSYSLFSPALVMIAGVLLLIIFGRTTGPQDQNDSINEHPIVSAATRLSPIFTQEVLYWETSILQWSEEWKLDANFIATVMQIESCGDPTAVSGSGAMGLFQVMPYHFEEGENGYLPETNADRGLAYLRLALDKFNTNYELALAGYNGGISGAARPQSLWSDEMNRYVYWGGNIFKDTSQGKLSSPYLDEWLISGGASLCRQSRQHLGLAD